MKLLAILLALPFAAFAARTTTVLPLEASGFADMEAVTNIELVVDHSRFDSMRFVVELGGSATNGVEVALGADPNQDGALSQEEAGVFFGYDCGEWFLRGDDSAEAVCAVEGERVSREFVFRKRAFSPEWNIVRVAHDRHDLVHSLGDQRGARLEPVQVDVRQKRRDDPSLRGAPALGIVPYAVRLDYRGLQPLAYHSADSFHSASSAEFCSAYLTLFDLVES